MAYSLKTSYLLTFGGLACQDDTGGKDRFFALLRITLAVIVMLNGK
jgi:hypothetical protein